MNEEEALSDLKKLFKKEIPSNEAICKATFLALLGKQRRSSNWIKSNFSNLVINAESTAHKIYRDNERSAAVNALKCVFRDIDSNESGIESSLDIFDNYYSTLDKFYLGISQGRKSRAGKTFEYIINELINALNYPYTAQAVINGKPDFLMPSKEHYQINPMDCIIFTAKRTLRERWRQITTEGSKGMMFFLATIDEKIKRNDLNEMMKNRIYIVVPSALKNQLYSEYVNAITFETFFDQHLDPAMKRWKKNKII